MSAPVSCASAAKHRVLFLHWGRRGSVSHHLLDIVTAARASDEIDPFVSVSRQSESYELFTRFGERLFPVDTFERGHGALTQAWRLPSLARALTRFLRQQRIEAVVVLMPHVWSPLMSSAIRRGGARHISVIHDAERHPGDETGIVLRWLLRDARQADHVVTLSDAVADTLLHRARIPADRIIRLRLPDLDYGASASRQPPTANEPWRLLFLGRLMRYKGLSLCIDAVELLKRQGYSVALGVYGEGDLGDEDRRLRALGAEVVNRWLSEGEIAQLLPRYHLMILSYIEASQSGVAAAAFGSGMPVVATRVGGLVEQVRPGRNGVLAEDLTSEAIADAISRLIAEPETYLALCRHIEEDSSERSARRFVSDLARQVFG